MVEHLAGGAFGRVDVGGQVGALDERAHQTLSVPAAIRARRTTRHFQPAPIAPELIDELLDLAVQAPSAWNMQDRSIVVVTSESGRQALSKAAFGQPQPLEAPVVLVFVADPTAWQDSNADIAELAATARGTRSSPRCSTPATSSNRCGNAGCSGRTRSRTR
ncbi:nitroreductase family protein [Nocardia colli]|uniref:nitroreductase family protein n=1 Tax=Nocardia colli TaxID=2545717 RepID=UPI0037C5A431